MVFALILVFFDNDWLVIFAVALLFIAYFGVQVGMVRAKSLHTEWVAFSITGYTAAFLFIEDNHLPRIYLGWFWIIFVSTLICFTSLKYLRKTIKLIKQICMGNTEKRR